jgi:predicted nucleic acid-binding protein
MKPVIFDTGPLVAWFCPRDKYHDWALKSFAQISAGGLICEAVLAEVCHLVAKDGIPRGKVLEFVEQGGLTPVF